MLLLRLAWHRPSFKYLKVFKVCLSTSIIVVVNNHKIFLCLGSSFLHCHISSTNRCATGRVSWKSSKASQTCAISPTKTDSRLTTMTNDAVIQEDRLKQWTMDMPKNYEGHEFLLLDQCCLAYFSDKDGLNIN